MGSIAHNRLLTLSAVILIGLAASLILYYAATVPVEKSFGERYVTAEIPLIFPFYVISSFKPITLITYLIFAAGVLILDAAKDRLVLLDTRGIRILLLVVSFASGYELIWNFSAWFAVWQRFGGSIDLLANVQHAYSSLPVNFNFATKVSFLVFALSLYGSLFLQSIERKAKAASP
jgi:hypothetical protein